MFLRTLTCNTGSQYNLWLGTGNAEPALSDLIQDLSRQSSPSTIPFVPHATLLSSSIIGPTLTLDEIKARVSNTVKSLSLSCVVCKFDKVEAGALFFQCVYVKLQKEESDGLLELHTALRNEFGDKEDPEGTSYFPHMSLVYGDIPMKEREKVVDDLLTSQRAVKLENGHDEVLGLNRFETRGIQIVRTVGRSDEWEIVSTIPLTNPA